MFSFRWHPSRLVRASVALGLAIIGAVLGGRHCHGRPLLTRPRNCAEWAGYAVDVRPRARGQRRTTDTASGSERRSGSDDGVGSAGISPSRRRLLLHRDTYLGFERLPWAGRFG
jgi:hypothetical protein